MSTKVTTTPSILSSMCSIGPHSQQIPAAGVASHFALAGRKIGQNFASVLPQTRMIDQPVGKVGNAACPHR